MVPYVVEVIHQWPWIGSRKAELKMEKNIKFSGMLLSVCSLHTRSSVSSRKETDPRTQLTSAGDEKLTQQHDDVFKRLIVEPANKGNGKGRKRKA